MASKEKSLSLFVLLMFGVFQGLLFFKAGAVTPNSVIQEAAESHALLAWKASLEKHSLLHSWSFHNNNATSGESKRNTPCIWFGITCNAAGRVKEINLFSASLKGKLENLSFSSFPDLTILNLSSNALHGTVPTHIGYLTKLSILDLSMNQFFSDLPHSLGNLIKLTTMYIYKHSISGTISQEIRYLRNFIKLDLSQNFLTGSIPLTLRSLTKLTTLSIHENNISNSILQEMGNLKILIDLRMSYNLLTGSIPSTLGNLTKLATLYIGENKVSGFIP
ncbi:putative LRR receptor-like serine/threonine-protein kinase [Cinnamomum micranthum f. kanehirae]|uniref:Putative LRR receptor-like serine/threonine-protein kinase n=1 Tax=Cinnamomum micranthum f. kanehirae TaxID=337451 RepID=A0A3S3R9W8_9MAGN|nr:putative LRR receptor-like serine/threonine-protein kinase [Cinnamomum micranthum f. kanehirae]